jgi:hypothetical protein
MKSVLIWFLRIITMPLRLCLAAFMVIAALCFVIPIGIIFTIGNPEDSIEFARETLFTPDWLAVGKMIIFGIK